MQDRLLWFIVGLFSGFLFGGCIGFLTAAFYISFWKEKRNKRNN